MMQANNRVPPIKLENDIDLYADDIEDFAQDDFGGENVDLYDDVISAPGNSDNPGDSNHHAPPGAGEDGGGNFVGTGGASNNINSSGRRHQLYVGNLTWWTTDRDIENAVHDIGVTDFHEVKFFEHRANGQSKGFCVISLGSEGSMRLCLELLSKKEINGQTPLVTLPTKQALSNFESQSKTRPSPANNSNSRPPHPNNNVHSGPMQNYGGRMPMNPSMRPMPPGMQGAPRMQGPPGFNGPPNMNQQPPRFQGNPQWNGPRPNGPGPNMGMRPMGPPHGQPGPPRPPMGPPQQGPPRGMPPQGPPQMRPEWNRPPMQQGYPQGPPHMQGPNMGPRGPPQMGPPGAPQPQGPAPHVNPAFFQQGGGPPPPMQHMPGPGPGIVTFLYLLSRCLVLILLLKLGLSVRWNRLSRVATLVLNTVIM